MLATWVNTLYYAFAFKTKRFVKAALKNIELSTPLISIKILECFNT